MNNQYFIRLSFLLGITCGFTDGQDQPRGEPNMESTQLEVICNTHQGIIKFRAFADEALHYENGDKIYPKGVYVEFYETDQQVSVSGRANSVYFITEENVYEFRGDVELKSLKEKKQLNTEQLYWDPETETFYTDTFIRIETEDKQLLTGEGLTAKQDLSYYKIAKVQGVLNVKSIKQE